LDIERRDGFLYLKDGPEIRFRKPGDLKRDIRQIAPEELAEGMLEILKHNVSVEKEGLYRTLAQQCGVTRLTSPMVECFEKALSYLSDKVEVVNNQVTLKD